MIETVLANACISGSISPLLWGTSPWHRPCLTSFWLQRELAALLNLSTAQSSSRGDSPCQKLSLSLSLSLSPPYLSLSKLSFSLGLPFSLTSFLPVCPVISFPFSFLPLCQFISLILVSLHLCITYRCLPEIVAIFYVDEARQSSLSRAVASLSLSLGGAAWHSWWARNTQRSVTNTFLRREGECRTQAAVSSSAPQHVSLKSPVFSSALKYPTCVRMQINVNTCWNFVRGTDNTFYVLLDVKVD